MNTEDNQQHHNSKYIAIPLCQPIPKIITHLDENEKFECCDCKLKLNPSNYQYFPTLFDERYKDTLKHIWSTWKDGQGNIYTTINGTFHAHRSCLIRKIEQIMITKCSHHIPETTVTYRLSNELKIIILGALFFLCLSILNKMI
jgi:hypothetical protein